jgi:signal transduction histidine kinase/ActR/RegA family two-component response regulator
MKRKIILSFLVLFVLFFIGAAGASLYVSKTTAELNRLLQLHQIEHLRRDLVINVQTVQSDLYAFNTPFAGKLNSIVRHVSELEKAAETCGSCHHSAEVSGQLHQLRGLIEDYQYSLSYYMTASANAERIRSLATGAASIGNDILSLTEQMSLNASKKLGTITDNAMKRINDVKNILILTVMVSFGIGILIAIRITHSMTRPIREILTATRAIAGGSVGHKVTYRDETEFGELAHNFNIMSAALEEKQMIEEQLRHSQKMEAIGTLTAGFAHEYNNIMTSIAGFAEILREEIKEDGPLSEYAGNIISSVERATKLTKSLLAYSRKQITHTEVLDINETVKLVKNVISGAMKEDIELRIQPAEEELAVDVDEAQIEHAWINLATNAIDAMPEGGTLTIQTQRIEYASDFIDNQAHISPGKYALISIADTGKGMDLKTQEKMFEPFFTTKGVGKGTGLGLSMVYGIIKRHGGYVSVSSHVGRGTTFRIYLPLCETEIGEKQLQKLEQPSGGTERVLVAEDDQEVRKFIKRVLERSGYEVVEALDGEDAVQQYMEKRATIDLLVFDIIMPKRNGADAYKEIKRVDSSAKAVFVSGYLSDDAKVRAVIDEDYKLIFKPIKANELLLTIRNTLDSSS